MNSYSNGVTIERLWVGAWATGIGGSKRAGGVSVEPHNTEGQSLVKLSIGRKNYLAKAWADLTMAQAHELACVLMHLTHSKFPCTGEGIKVEESHSVNLKVDLDFTVDLCTMVDKADLLEELMIAQVRKKLQEIRSQLPKKEVSNVPSK
jgi:hypothetical protein